MKAALLTLLLLFHGAAQAVPGWNIRESSAGTELQTPYGVKEVVGELAAPGTNAYRVEIPLDELKPPPQPEDPKKDREPTSEGGKNERWETVIEKEITKTSSGDKNCDDCEKRKPAAIPPKVIVEYDDTDRYVVEANRLYNRGKFYDATNVVEELLRKKPDHVRGWVMKGSLMRVQGHKAEAKAAYQTALKLDPENTELKKIVEKYYK
jgi:tetratricopeptide (TPR) repeat protein